MPGRPGPTLITLEGTVITRFHIHHEQSQMPRPHVLDWNGACPEPRSSASLARPACTLPGKWFSSCIQCPRRYGSNSQTGVQVLAPLIRYAVTNTPILAVGFHRVPSFQVEATYSWLYCDKAGLKNSLHALDALPFRAPPRAHSTRQLFLTANGGLVVEALAEPSTD